MKKQDKEKFYKWYDEVKDKEFNFKNQMYEYCKSDVDILRRGRLAFRDMFLRIDNVDPFIYITIAGVCMAVYRNECLPDNTIAIVDELQNDVYSIKSIKC